MIREETKKSIREELAVDIKNSNILEILDLFLKFVEVEVPVE